MRVSPGKTGQFSRLLAVWTQWVALGCAKQSCRILRIRMVRPVLYSLILAWAPGPWKCPFPPQHK